MPMGQSDTVPDANTNASMFSAETTEELRASVLESDRSRERRGFCEHFPL
jgi:hypothetical protein